jgi:hypothetical protein
MPTCKNCGRYGNVLTVDPCPHCNAKDWLVDENNPVERQESGDAAGCGCAGIAGLFWLALVFGGLWLLVFVVKWMWRHS